ncbi:MAG: hypothetical protein NZM11_03630, partial [Anaerolineales bacterium]|nr:hypothetical protein [Anaerolineales bacterium]
GDEVAALNDLCPTRRPLGGLSLRGLALLPKNKACDRTYSYSDQSKPAPLGAEEVQDVLHGE